MHPAIATGDSSQKRVDAISRTFGDRPVGRFWEWIGSQSNPKQMGGVPCIRGLRIPVATVVGMIASGMTPGEVVDELPPLDLDDVAAALRFAADAVADRC